MAPQSIARSIWEELRAGDSKTGAGAAIPPVEECPTGSEHGRTAGKATKEVGMMSDREDHAHGPLRAGRFSVPLPPVSQDEPATILPDHISQNIEAIKALHARATENLSRYQRPIETLGTFLGHPGFFYGIVLFVVVWVLLNVFSPRFG